MLIHNYFVMTKLKLLIILTACAYSLWGQLPKTDIYLAKLYSFEGKPAINNISFLNSFNPNGYNNQANFFKNNYIYITSDYQNEGFTDIIALDPLKKELFKVTDTQGISEFSPTPIPKSDDFCTVRIEKDGKDQSLWQYPISRDNNGYRLFPALTNVGYFCWLNRTTVAMFLVGEPNQLVIGNSTTDKSSLVVTNPGRCLKTDNLGFLYFIHKISTDLWILKSYDLNKNVTHSICKMPEGKEDFDILYDGTFISAANSLILRFDPKLDIQWQVVADLSHLGINNIQRPIIKDKQLIFINAK